MLVPAAGRLPSSPVTKTDFTWNSSDAGTNVTISDSSRLATVGATVPGYARSTQSFSASGIRLISFSLQEVTSGTCLAGIAPSIAPLNAGPGGANTGNNVVFYGLQAYIGGSGSSIFSGGSQTVNDVIDMWLDFSVMKVWFRHNGRYWNNNSAYNPNTNSGGIDISGAVTAGATYYLLGGGNSTNNAVRIVQPSVSFAV